MEPLTPRQKKELKQQRQQERLHFQETRDQPSAAEVALKRAQQRFAGLSGQSDVAAMVRKWSDPNTVDPVELDKTVRLVKVLIRKGYSREFNDQKWKRACMQLAELPWLQEPEDWKPSGKSDTSIWKSLVRHLLFKYPMPEFFAKLFLPENATGPVWTPQGYQSNQKIQLRILSDLGRGESLYRMVQAKRIAVPLTRKMCHIFMTLRGEYTFAQAIYAAQCQAFELSQPTMITLLQSRLFESISGDGAYETRLQEWIHWLSQNAMIPLQQIPNLCDYVRDRILRDRDFNVFGRTAQALIELMEAWHRDLYKDQDARAKSKGVERYERSGFAGMEWTQECETRQGYAYEREWEMREVLTYADLRAEGTELKHCVISYSYYIVEGKTSIWSLRSKDMIEGDKRQLTIEVRNQSKQIVQVRGSCNRLATHSERKLVNEWAARNNLTMMA